MKTKDLLSQLSHLEGTVNNFSFEKLDITEANPLKKSFQAFKVKLENKIFERTSVSNNSLPSYEKELYSDTSSKTANLLIANISHEIRTILNGINGFSDLLIEDKLTPIQLERVAAIETASYSLIEIINELLEYSKLSSGIEQFETIDFNFHALINDVIYLCKTLVTNKNVALNVKIDPKIPEILLGDPSKLTQVLLKLIGNAIKFIHQGNVNLDIKLKQQTNEKHIIEFSIINTGIGISKENLKHIFDPYKQVEDNTHVKYGGTRLGLCIVKQIIDNLKGDITVSSELGEGTTFKFLLPYAQGNTKKIAKNNLSRSIKSKSKNLAKALKIVVFEDNILHQKLIEQLLESWKCKTYITDNAEYGLYLLENNEIDIVLMDLKLPKMNGFEFAKLIRKSKNKAVKNIPIIALTADFSLQDKKQCIAHGINDFILKPYNPDELLSKILKNKKLMERTVILESKAVNATTELKASKQKINLLKILEECMGEITLLQELVVLFKQNAIEFINLSGEHLKEEDIQQLGFAAHKIKSGLAMLKAEGLHGIIVQIQNTCKTDGDLKHLEFLCACFANEYPKVALAIDKEMKKLESK